MGFKLIIFSLCNLFSILFTTAAVYDPVDIIKLDCGAATDNTDWVTDHNSKFMPQNSNNFVSDNKQATSIPYLTARIFESEFTYTFPLSTGPKFLRLYFSPANYSGRDITNSFFDVTASGRLLVGNFSAFLHSDANSVSFFKEFVVNVGDNQNLRLTFTPSTVDTYAFVNGIEIVSMPDNLYLNGVNSNTTVVGQNKTTKIDTTTTLQTVYRLNVGGQPINPSEDTGMFRLWGDDINYINIAGKTPGDNFEVLYNETEPYTAPTNVYTSQRNIGPDYKNIYMLNLSWSFKVDSGFSYLIRLHFCEFIKDIDGTNQRVFTVFLGGSMADERVDVFDRAGGKFIPIFNDYIVSIPLENTKLEISLNPVFLDVVLNGLEIFKLNKSDGSLAGPNPTHKTIPNQSVPSVYFRKQNSFPIRRLIEGVAGGVVLIGILVLLVFMGMRKKKNSSISMAKTSWINFTNTTKESSKGTISILPSDLCRRFSLEEVKSATRNFDEDLVVGVGGFGYVYKGFIETGGISVAIKRLNPESKQGAREFQTEIEMLSKLRHLHLVSLIGYCNEDGEMILVYEYMSGGTLKQHLYKTKNQPLTWKQRLNICIGAARGLHYLHTGSKQSIIHRDVKSTNILLDEKLMAKVSDFGLSKLGPTDLLQTHVSTAVKGSLGYLDPEYYRRQWLTEKSDVYSYGVVLLEVMCGRPPIIVGLQREQVNLAEWARHCYKKGTVNTMIDPFLDGQFVAESMNKFFEVAFNCVRDNGIDRPVMNDVVWSLEFAMQLQEVAEKNSNMVDGQRLSSFNSAGDRPLFGDSTTSSDRRNLFSVSRSVVASTAEEISGEDDDSTRTVNRFVSKDVFSDLMNPRGR